MPTVTWMRAPSFFSFVSTEKISPKKTWVPRPSASAPIVSTRSRAKASPRRTSLPAVSKRILPMRYKPSSSHAKAAPSAVRLETGVKSAWGSASVCSESALARMAARISSSARRSASRRICAFFSCLCLVSFIYINFFHTKNPP